MKTWTFIDKFISKRRRLFIDSDIKCFPVYNLELSILVLTTINGFVKGKGTGGTPHPSSFNTIVLKLSFSYDLSGKILGQGTRPSPTAPHGPPMGLTPI